MKSERERERQRERERERVLALAQLIEDEFDLDSWSPTFLSLDAMTEFEWSDETAGQFINLTAFANDRSFWSSDARLPDWKTIRTEFPHLIHLASAGSKRLFISHRWDGRDHPDPSGWQLQALRKLGEHYNYSGAELCFWYDFMSLPQRPRSSGENKIFGAGLRNIRRIVGECENVCLISHAGDDRQQDLAAMLSRGWIVFELYIARSRVKRLLPLYQCEGAMIEFGRTQSGWDDVVPDIQAIAPVDTPELLHSWLKNRGIRCTNGSDLALLARLLHDELARFEQIGPTPDVPLGTPVTITTDEIVELGIVSSSRRSMRFPELYLDKDDFDPATHLWTVTFCRRPLLPPMGAEMKVGPSELEEFRIDAATGLSPLYPGIFFNLSLDGTTLRFEVV